MKKVITFSILCMVCLFSRAQYIKIHVDAGELENSLTEEQMQEVEEMVLIGSLNAADLSVINERMPKLRRLVLEEISLDTIPAKAFYGNKSLRDICSPLQIEYIGDRAFEGTEILLTITGRFPRMGDWVFGDKKFNIDIPKDNEYCKNDYGYVYSKDEKILYYIYPSLISYESFSSETEVIAGWALAFTSIRRVGFPSALKKIEKHAFAKTEVIPLVASYYSYEPTRLDFYSAIPPVLEDSVFTENEIFRKCYYIRVPENCGDIYRASDPQWSVFHTIVEGEIDPYSVSPNSLTSLSVIRENGYWRIHDEDIIKSIEIINTMGMQIYSATCNATEIMVPFSNFYGINYLRVCYKDNKVKVIKITN